VWIVVENAFESLSSRKFVKDEFDGNPGSCDDWFPIIKLRSETIWAWPMLPLSKYKLE
jgi:hypothetical protein